MPSGWLSFLIVVVLIVSLGLGAYSVARSPKFYADLIVQLVPLLRGVVTRMSPEDERKMHDAVRRGQEWDNFHKRPRDR